MNNEIITPNVVEQLLSDKQGFHVFAPGDTKVKSVIEWINQSFECSSSHILWDSVVNSDCRSWESVAELVSVFSDLSKHHNLVDQFVYLVWGDPRIEVLRLRMLVAQKYAIEIFTQDEDAMLWLASPENGWCIEIDGAGDICYGKV